MNQDKDEFNEIPEQQTASGAVRGKYYERYMHRANVILLAPDVAEVFRDSESVNKALRAYVAEHGAPPSKGAD